MAPDPADAYPPVPYHEETFTAAETAVLERFFTNTKGPVFALVGLPEVVRGALFARYSRTSKSIRRLFLDEFFENPGVGVEAVAARIDGDDERVRRRRAEDLYRSVFVEFGDDSVAQLGGAHLACEQASNILTKVLEWGRLASYLEQSTRYIYFDRPLGDRYRYLVPPEVEAVSLADPYCTVLDTLFLTYAELVEPLTEHYRSLHPRGSDSDAVYRSTIRAMACDDLRGLLPAATQSNLGIFGSGQAYEMLLMRMRAHPLAEARGYADLMLTELRKVIPSFLRRVDLPERGGAWSAYLAETADEVRRLAVLLPEASPDRPEVTLVDWDPEGEAKVAAAALYAQTDLPDDVLLRHVGALPAAEQARIIRAYAGDRGNRRHKPGRAMERIGYRFDVLSDYGIFRDLQRHRLLTLEWQQLGTSHGFITPPSLAEIGAVGPWEQAMRQAASLHRVLARRLGGTIAQYAVPLAYRIRFYLHMNAREAFHLLELRTQRSGHAGYRRVCAEMHRLIREQAGHPAIAAAMKYVDHTDYGLTRIEAERSTEKRRDAGPGPD